jgi:pyruvate kinase
MRRWNGFRERRSLAAEVHDLRRALTAAGDHDGLHRVAPEHRDDACNLLHYLALRRQDVRGLQRRLAEHGLSSLGRSEAHVLATVDAVLTTLRGRWQPPSEPDRFQEGRVALDRNTDAFFGVRPEGRVPRIMVTLPAEAASEPGVVARFVELGMDVARINAAHGGPDDWRAMAANVRAAAAAAGRPVAVSVDLPGPKLRTGPIAEGPRVLRFRPVRDRRGAAVSPAIVALGAAPVADGVVPVDGAWLRDRRPGDEVTFADARGAKRTMTVTTTGASRVTASLWDTAYLETGTVLRCGHRETEVGVLPPVEEAHVLRPGDLLHVEASNETAQPWRSGMPGAAVIGCSLPVAVRSAQVGHRIALDDGRFTGIVESATDDRITVRILTGPLDGGRLRAAKGINLPDTDLPIPMIDDSDVPVLEVAAADADLLALSFLRHEDDVDDVVERVAAVGGQHLGLLLKIETIPGFERLPEILLRSLQHPRVGVMIARGDLAVELSYERLAEVQEEVLWLCEAARVPVVWATEVLDRLARTGRPTRAEITDAAMAQRAECVMLNKGPHVDAAITLLDDVLRRMAGHQRKKTALLRPLRAWIPED